MFEFSLIAALCALVLFVIWRWSGHRSWFKLAVVWMLYAGYEFLMYKRVWCTGDCNIRVDLLLIFPLLLGGTLWVGIAVVVRRVRRQHLREGDASTR